MRTALLLAGLCLLLTATPASAFPGDVTVEVAGHNVTYTDPDYTLCQGDVGYGNSGTLVEAHSGAGGPYTDECRHYVRVL